jgi:hypothetical protein
MIIHPAVCIRPFAGGDMVSRLVDDDDVILDEDEEARAAAERCA